MVLSTSAPFISRSFEGCPAPAAAEVLSFAQQFGVGVVSLRPSSRSFSGWVAVCSFSSASSAAAFSGAAASYFLGEGCFCKVRPVGKRFRVSVPVLSPPCLVFVRHRDISRWFRLGNQLVRLR